MTRFIFLGAPGAGKGTQAEMLAISHNIPHISTGDILRQAVAARSELGIQAKRFIDNGELVPDSLVVGLIRERLQQSDAEPGWILDGFPRNISQAHDLNALLEQLGESYRWVIYFAVEQETLIQRMLDRGRQDDNDATVRRRLEVYEEQTTPLIDFYQAQDRLKVINGNQGVEAVAQDLQLAIAP